MKITFKYILILLFLSNSLIFAYDSTIKSQSAFVDKRIQITWGIKTKTKQIWDGHVEINNGEVLKVVPFIRHGMIDESKLVTKHSWTSKTYTNKEGVFLFVQVPKEAIVKVITKSHTFEFSLEDFADQKILTRMDGDIEIKDITDDVIYQIKGLEYGQYGSGTAIISPEVTNVDSYETWTITYTADKIIPVGGGIRISCHFTRTCGNPQFFNPNAPNFVSVSTNGKSEIDYKSEHRGLFEYPFTQSRLLIWVLKEPLLKGEQIRIVLGDKSSGSPGFKTPLVSEKNFEFRIESCTEVPDVGFPIYRRIEKFPSLDIITKLPAERIFVVAPSIVKPNEIFRINLIVEDKYRNTVEDFTGTLSLFLKSITKKKMIGSYNFAIENNGKISINNLKVDSAGTYRFIIETGDNLVRESNPIICQENAENYKLFWGELHGHTKLSDGYGSADDYFSFAKDKALLNFAAITDHDVELDAPDFTVNGMWNNIKTAVSNFNNPPNFITLLGWEWSPNRITSTTEYPYGDHNVFYFDNNGTIYPTGNNASNSLPELYQNLKFEKSKKNKVITIPHVGGAIANLEFHESNAEPLLEIYSVHGSFESLGQMALERGYKIGFVGGSDSHNGQVGGFPPGGGANHFVHGGLTAVFAKDLTRESLYDALINHRTYATTGKRISIDFKINDACMGEEILVNDPPKIRVNVFGENTVWKVELIKNGKVIHSHFNPILPDNQINILWRNRIEKNDLSDFDSGFWSRRLRSVHWNGKVVSSKKDLKFLQTNSFDFPKDKIYSSTSGSIVWKSDTRGDYDGISFEVKNSDSEFLLTFSVQSFGMSAISQGFIKSSVNEKQTYNYTINPSEIDTKGLVYKINPLDEIIILKGEQINRQIEFEFVDKRLMYRENYYYVRVTQIDGEMAWSSPIWVRYNLAN